LSSESVIEKDCVVGCGNGAGGSDSGDDEGATASGRKGDDLVVVVD
jgi:hypothetical protein